MKHSLFDLQVNGFGGVDFQRADLGHADLTHAVRVLGHHQTHRFFLTLITDDVEALCRKFERIEGFRQSDPALREAICGYHLEGPYINSALGYRGAHPERFSKPPDLREFARLQEAAGGGIKLLTLAPELPGSPEAIAGIKSQGVVVALGHTAASDREIDEAIAAGATLCTHLGNGCPEQMHRHDNIIQRLLARDELTACFIPDGIHLPPFVLKNLVRAKPPGKVVFTTDAMAAAGAPPGTFTVGESTVYVAEDGVVRQPGSTGFNGSSLTPDRGVANASRWLGISTEEARSWFSTVPAKLFGITLPVMGDQCEQKEQ